MNGDLIFFLAGIKVEAQREELIERNMYGDVWLSRVVVVVVVTVSSVAVHRKSVRVARRQHIDGTTAAR